MPTLWALDSQWLNRLYYHVNPDPPFVIGHHMRLILRILRERKPDYLVAAVEYDDSQCFRRKLWPEYKAKRLERPEGLAYITRATNSIMTTMGIPVLDHPEHEADDVLATVSRQAVERGVKCVLVGSDKDLRQCLRPGWVTSYRKPQKQDWEFITAAKAEDKWGLPVERFVEYQALVGDTSDGIPGCEGVGDKTARKLLTEYGSLDAVLAHQGHSGRLGERLAAFRENVDLTLKLVRLVDDLPLLDFWPCAGVGPFGESEIRSECAGHGVPELADQIMDAERVMLV